MRPLVKRAVVAIALIGVGWAAAKAQSTVPDFELVVNAPTGQTTIQCMRGCRLSWIGRGLNPNSMAIPSFSFSCSAPQGCSSSTVGGWIAQ